MQLAIGTQILRDGWEDRRDKEFNICDRYYDLDNTNNKQISIVQYSSIRTVTLKNYTHNKQIKKFLFIIKILCIICGIVYKKIS